MYKFLFLGNYKNKIYVKSCRDHEVTISANREGLLSLASQLKTLAEGMPGDHIHYDEHNSLEKGSWEMIIEKAEC